MSVQLSILQDEKHYFHIAGTFFLGAQLIILSALAFNEETRTFLVWSCNNFCFFLAIACYLKSMQLVKGVAYVGLVVQLLWMADFLSPYFGANLSGISDYIAIEGFTYANIVSIALHTGIPFLVLALSFRIRPEPRSLLYSFPYILFLFIVTFFFTAPDRDINCVFAACNLNTFFTFSIPYHIALWPLFAMGPAFLGYVIHKVLYFVWHDIFKGRRHARI